MEGDLGTWSELAGWSLQRAGEVASRLRQPEAEAIHHLWEYMLEQAPLEADRVSAIADETYDTWRAGAGRRASDMLAGRFKTCLRGLALGLSAHEMGWANWQQALGPWIRQATQKEARDGLPARIKPLPSGGGAAPSGPGLGHRGGWGR